MPAKSRKTSQLTPLNPDVYASLIRAALPVPPQTAADNEKLTDILLNLTDRGEMGELTPEETAFA
jgi:hypothetical protein